MVEGTVLKLTLRELNLELGRTFDDFNTEFHARSPMGDSMVWRRSHRLEHT